VGSLLFAIALSRGFQHEVQRALLASSPHISIFPAVGRGFENWKEVQMAVAKVPGIREASPSAEIPAALITETGTHLALLQTLAGQEELPETLQITIGIELAARAGLEPGMSTTILTAQAPDTIHSSEVLIAGLERTGNFDADLRTIRATTDSIARLTGDGEFIPDALAVRLEDPFESETTAASIRERIGQGYRVVDWQEANRPLFAALTLERRAAFIIIGLIIAVAVLNITTTLALGVVERRLEIAVLRTCGARGRELAGIFVADGVFLGAVGLSIGIAAGLASVVLANYFGIINLDPEVYSVGRVVLEPRAYDVAWIAAGVLGLSIAATLYPAISAARLKPMENFRIN
jgi:lipoprotein-releasing system permease protein